MPAQALASGLPCRPDRLNLRHRERPGIDAGVGGEVRRDQPTGDAELLRAILDTAQEAFIMMDSSGLILAFNQRNRTVAAE